MRAVRFDGYGDVDVLNVREVEDPVERPGRAVVEVRAAGINPGEIVLREGLLHERWPATFPTGQGSDLAGVVRHVGNGVTVFGPGDKVLGWSDERASHAELVSVPARQLTSKPSGLSWEIAGSLFVAGMAAMASVCAVDPQPGEAVVVSGAAGGVGSITVQLARHTGAVVIGLASEDNHSWLRKRDVVSVAYGVGQTERIRAAADGPIHAFVDTFGGGYVDLAIELGVAPGRINTIIDAEAAQRTGASMRGTHSIANVERLANLAELAAGGSLDVPIAGTYSLEQVREAYTELAKRHTRGKIVLVP